MWKSRIWRYPMPEIEISVIGNYEVDSGIVTVTYNGRKKSTQLGGSPAEYIAQRLLREILEDPAGKFSGPT
jgi:hypothetical protein